MHGSSRVLLPVQGKPSQSGVRLLHVLVSFLIPPPHVLLHDPRVHELHPPSTAEQLCTLYGRKRYFSVDLLALYVYNYNISVIHTVGVKKGSVATL